MFQIRTAQIHSWTMLQRPRCNSLTHSAITVKKPAFLRGRKKIQKTAWNSFAGSPGWKTCARLSCPHEKHGMDGSCAKDVNRMSVFLSGLFLALVRREIKGKLSFFFSLTKPNWMSVSKAAQHASLSHSLQGSIAEVLKCLPCWENVECKSCK